MLGNKMQQPTLRSRLEIAKKFYEGILGLAQVDAGGQEAIVFKSGNSTVIVYRSQYARTNQTTAVAWMVGEDIEGLCNN